MECSDEVKQDFILWLHVFEKSIFAMQVKIKTDIGRHVFQRLIDGHFYLADCAPLIGGGIDLEHPSEGRVGIGAAAVPELGLTAWDVVIEDYHLHLVFEDVHHILYRAGIVQCECKEHIVVRPDRLLHLALVQQFRQLQRHDGKEVIAKLF